ncbi:MAG: transposase [Clostridiales bacterium]|nr:transposase [Clostridiales bacterium]
MIHKRRKKGRIRKRRHYTAEYKARIVLEVLREENTVSEIGVRENINPQ